MEFISNVFGPVIFGILLIVFSDQIARFFETTGSTSLIRGLDNPWTFKTVGFVIALGYPIYYFVTILVLKSLTS